MDATTTPGTDTSARAEPQLSRPNCFEIDLDAIADNVREVRRITGGAQLFAALKANAYGYGLHEVAGVVLGAGADGLAMVDVRDAVDLRRRGVTAPLLLYGGMPVSPDVVAAVERAGIMPTLSDLGDAEMYARHAAGTISVFVKVDVGHHRLGVAPEEAVGFVKAITQLPKLALRGVYTHMHAPAGGGEDVQPYLAWQFRRYTGVLAELQRIGIHVPIRMAASSGVMRHSLAMSLDAVDVGDLLYGHRSLSPTAVAPDLRPAFHAFKSRLVQVKPVSRTEYRDQAPFPLRPGMRIGVIPCGMADGMSTLNCGQALVRGRRVAVLAVSLEHTRVDLTDVEAQAGDEVVFIGRQGDEAILLREIALYQGFKHEMEVALAVRASVPRVYLRRTGD
ncbi:MAG: alanine racemase [Chloroflexi bacterium]|nr:alanine racemase [Chloroflexota bacterium]